MIEAARTLALLSALALVVSFTIWASMLEGPMLQRLDGSRASNDGPAELAMKTLVLAFLLSSAAAVLAIVVLIVS